ncbi:hypothetical protein ACHAQH_003771, partial [Verticillium albo-atrum]
MAKERRSGKYTVKSKGRKVSSNPTSQLQVIRGSVDDRDQLAEEDDSIWPTTQKARSGNMTFGDDWTARGSATNPSSEHSGHASENKMTVPVGHNTLGQDWNDLAEDFSDILQDGHLDTVTAGQSNAKSSSPSTLKERQRTRHPRKSGTIAMDQSQNTMAIGFSEIPQSEDASFLQDGEYLDDLFVPSSSLDEEKGSQVTKQKPKGRRAPVKTQPNPAIQAGSGNPSPNIKKSRKTPASKSSKAASITADTTKRATRARTTKNSTGLKELRPNERPQQPGPPISRPPQIPKKPEKIDIRPAQRKKLKQIAKTPFQDAAKHINTDLEARQDAPEDSKRELEMETQVVGLHDRATVQTHSDLTCSSPPQTSILARISGSEPKENQLSRNDMSSGAGSDATDHVLELKVLDAAATISILSDASARQDDCAGLLSDFSMLDVFNDDDFQELAGRSKTVAQSNNGPEAKRNHKEPSPTKRRQGTAPAKPEPRQPVKQASKNKRTDFKSTNPKKDLASPEVTAIKPQLKPISISSDECSELSDMDFSEAKMLLSSRQPPQDAPAGLVLPIKLTPEQHSGNQGLLLKARAANDHVSTKTRIIAFNAEGPMNSGRRSLNKRIADASPSSGHQKKRVKPNHEVAPAPSKADSGRETSMNILADGRDDSPACAAIVEQMTRIEVGYSVTDSQSLGDLCQNGPTTQTSLRKSGPLQKVPISVKPSNDHMATERSQTGQNFQHKMRKRSRSRSSDAKPPTQFAVEGLGQPRRMFSRTRSIVDERGSPNPEETVTSTDNAAPCYNKKKRLCNPDEKPPVWHMPKKTMNNELSCTQQELNGPRSVFGATEERFLDMTVSKEWDNSLAQGDHGGQYTRSRKAAKHQRE